MENRAIQRTILSLLTIVTGIVFASCSDWTETVPVTLIEPDIKEQNPELYARYLEDLRVYKASDHKVVYAWFNNGEKVPFNRSQHLDNLPDSIDVIVLTHPDNLTESELAQMRAVQQEKGTKVIFSLSFDAIRLNYDTMVKEWKERGQEPPAPAGFIPYLTDTLQHTLRLVNRYNYDGISIAYNGKSLLHLDEREKEEQILNQTAYMGIIRVWMSTHEDKIAVFEGKPQNLTDKTILEACRHIILPMPAESNSPAFTYNISIALVEGVPTDRFVVTAETTSTDPSDTKTGYWTDGTRSIASAAAWASAVYPGFSVAGLAVYNINNDYFSTRRVYDYTKKAIDTLNPSFKSN